MIQTEFEAYSMFMALRAHMTSSYDYFKYDGKIKVSRPQFDRRNDKYQFAKLARLPDNKLRTVVSFLEGASWIGDVTGELGEDAYIKHKRYLDALRRAFADDIGQLIRGTSLAEALYPKANTTPRAAQLLFQQKIGIETLVILDDTHKITNGWALQYPLDPLMQKLVVNIRNYKGFFSYKPQIIRQILVDRL